MRRIELIRLLIIIFLRSCKAIEFMMNFQGCIAEVNASGNGSQTFQICSMAFNQNSDEEFVTIAHDGMIKIWNAHTMAMVKSARIKSGYLTSLINFQNGFIVGTGNGQLIKFTHHLERDWTKKVHFDCVNDVLQTEKYLVSVGSDGKICFLDKNTVILEKEIDTTVPLTRICKLGNCIYVAGNPSFKVNLDTFEMTKEQRSFQFMQFEGKILGCSDEQGLYILGNQDHLDHINCHFMLQFKSKIVAISEETIGVISLFKEEQGAQQISYRLYKASNLKKGYSIKTGLVHQNSIILAGQEGLIYKFKFSDSQKIKQ